jgi:peptide chain release factor 1
MLDRLQIVKQRFDEISDLIIQPDVISIKSVNVN